MSENAESTLPTPRESQQETSTDLKTSHLGPAVASDISALQSDLNEARRLAASYQAEAIGKESELAGLKDLFEKTRKHLIALQLNVTNLREERHRLANKAMETDALQRKLTLVTLERDRLQKELLSRDNWHG